MGLNAGARDPAAEAERAPRLFAFQHLQPRPVQAVPTLCAGSTPNRVLL